MIAVTILALDLVGGAPRFEPLRVDSPPTIDGRLDDDAWRAAPVSEAFRQKFPSPGQPPSERTTFRIVYDDEALYVGFECEHRHTPIVRRLSRRDREIDTEVVGFDLDTRRDGVTAFNFLSTEAGVQGDGIRFNDTEYSSEWDEVWEVATARTRTGWSAEFRIPLRILRFDDSSPQTWGMQVRRYLSAPQELVEWSWVPRTEAGEVSRYGRLGPLERLEPSQSLELRPAFVARWRRRDPDPDRIASGWDARGQVGLDAKWHLSQDLTLDATLLPDFGQVEADEVVLNLTTFETQFPEKRPFFLEGLDVFATPIGVLYTRRIGAQPDVPSLREGARFRERLFDVPEPSTIWGAGKLVGRVPGGLTVGLLSAVTGENDVQVRRLDGARGERLADPLTSQNVVRVLRELGDNGHVGLIAAATLRLEDPVAYPLVIEDEGPLSLCPGGDLVRRGDRCFHDAWITGIDGRWRSGSGDWVASGQLLASLVDEGPARSLSDGTVIDSGDLSPGGRLRLAKEGGEHWIGELEYEGYGRRLELNDLGFLQRQNLHRVWAMAAYRTTEPAGAWLETKSRLEVFYRWNLDGLIGSHGYQLNTYGKLTNRWHYFVEGHYRPAYFDDREVGDGTALEREGLLGLELYLGTDSGGKVFVEVEATLQRVFGGYNVELELPLTFQVVPELDLALIPEVAFAGGEPRFVEEGEEPGTYVFGRQRARSVGVTLRATWTFGPRLTLQAYAQLFLAAVHYHDFSSNPRPSDTIELEDLEPADPPAGSPDFFDGAFNASVVLRWEWALGSTLYAVYTRSQIPAVDLGAGEEPSLDLGAVRDAPAADVFLLKLSYWWG